MASCHEALFLVGPTATGKSAVAQYLAEADGCDILSADSMLVYRGMDIGTAKPTRAERERVRYWGVDLVDPGEPFSVARYLDAAREASVRARESGRGLIVTGGSGLYIRALLHGLDPMPASDVTSRARWQAVLRSGGVAALQEALRERAPAWFEQMADAANSRRLIRALELLDAGVSAPPAIWQRVGIQPEIAGLTAARAVVMARIESRVRAMYAAGLLQEVKALFGTTGLGGAQTAAQAVGYAEAWACLTGALSEEAAREKTVIRTRQLAKRQMTWFRRQCRVRWIDIGTETDVAAMARRVRAVWRETGATPMAL